MNSTFFLIAAVLVGPQEPSEAAAVAPAVERVLPRLSDAASIELAAQWDRCKRSLYGLFEENETLRDLRPAEPRKRHGAERFRAFLPTEPVAVGDVWSIDPEAALPLLAQFHPGATAEFSHPAARPGAFGCLRAAGEDSLEILFRTHARFRIAEHVTYMPAQFEGRLLLGRKDGSIRAFRLALPNRDTNVDVNAPMSIGPTGGIAADIGWVPRMELTGPEAHEPEWSSAVDLEEARLRLARRFYPFSAIDWLPFEEAVRRSRDLGKPLHAVLLFGSLDDESC